MDITIQNFEADLINASVEQPVLLDIWAPWCGPCKALTPVLEKIEVAYAGRFKLAKLNADEQPEISGQLSQMFGVRSIPFCVLFKGGQPVDGFVGALPEAQVREFLDRHVPSAEEAAAGEDLAAAEELLAEGDADSALERLQEAVAIDPGNDVARYDYLRALLTAGRVDDARRAFDPVASKVMLDARLAAAGHWLAASEKVRVGAQPRAAGGGDRREQAGFRRPLRTRPDALRRAALHAGDGRAARDRDARQGLERRAGAQDLRGDPRADEQAGAEGRGCGAEGCAGGHGQGQYRAGRPGHRPVPAQAEHGAVLIRAT
jgi:thioredoxin